MNYDTLLELAGDKPIALGEVGRSPTVEKLQEQPRWTWFMNWGQPGSFGEGFRAFLETYRSEEALTLEELPWVNLSEVKLHYPLLK